jgi:BolA family transcriptional regulator, general stress-responsive regulator
MAAQTPEVSIDHALAMSRAERLQQVLQQSLQPEHLVVLDESAAHAGHAGAGPLGFGTHLRVQIGMQQWPVQSRLARHRLVYDAASVFIQEGLHALAIEITEPNSAPASH